MHNGRATSIRSRFIGLFSALLVAIAGLPGPAAASSPDLVLSQVYGGGGNSGATLRNDFIELFNRGTTPIDVTGWSVQYASSGGSTWQRTDLAGVIPPGGYYLVQEAAGTGGSEDLPSPDAVGNIAMSATNGKVALATTTTLLTCGGASGPCLPNATIRDFVGYGSADNFEGSGPSGVLSNTTAALRAGDGAVDTDDNAADFAVGAPNPRNSSAGDPVSADCGGPITTEEGTSASTTVSGSDVDGTVVDLAITDVTPAPGAGTITLHDLVPAPGPGGTASATVSVDAAVPAGSYSVTITATNDDSSLQSDTCVLTVNVNAPAVGIAAIQGASRRSPVEGTTQTTTGVVTVILSSGFFMQDPAGDGNPATSEGLFVFTGSPVARTLLPGDQVTVSGSVVEFRSSTRPRDLTLTEITSATVAVTGTGATLPEAQLVGDRPDEVIEPEGIDTFEALEGMLVRVEDPTVVGPTNTFGEFVTVAAGDAANATSGGHMIVRDLVGDAVDYNPERIMIDDEARVPGGTGSGTRINNPQVDVRVGDVASGPIVGALDYQFGNFRVQASHPVAGVLAGTVPPSPVADLPVAAPYEGRIATFNVLNLFDCVDAPDKDDRASCSATALATLETQLTKLARAFEEELGSPEITIIEETENAEVLTGDPSGFVPGTTVPALLPRLDGDWDAVSFDASDVRGIEVGFVFNTDRVTLHDAFLATDLLPDTGGVFDGSTFRAGREPLVGLFTLDDTDVAVVGNHFKSKGGPQFGVEPGGEAGDDPLYGEFQPPVRWTEEIRHLQADYVRELVDVLHAGDPTTNIVVGGDLNDFAFAEPGEGLDTVARIKESATSPLTNVVDLIPFEDRYTFVFEGNSQVLDHMLIDSGMSALLRNQDIAHFNAGYPDVLGDDPSVTLKSSDHDPLVAYFCTDATAPSLTVEVAPDVLQPPNHRYRTVQATVVASDDADPDVAIELLSVTSSEPDDHPGNGDGNTRNDIVIIDEDTFRLRAERARSGPGRTYTITYQATDACGNSTVVSDTVLVPRDRS